MRRRGLVIRSLSLNYRIGWPTGLYQLMDIVSWSIFSSILVGLFGTGAVGAWLGATLYIMLLGGVLFYRFYGEQWREIRIFSDDAPVGRASGVD